MNLGMPRISRSLSEVEIWEIRGIFCKMLDFVIGEVIELEETQAFILFLSECSDPQQVKKKKFR